MLKTAIAHSEVLDLITRMAVDLKARIRPGAALVGIHTGGVWVAEHLNRHLDLPDPLGEINIAFYRDDFSHIGMHPSVRPSTLPFDVDGRHIVLVDDVLYTGRTVRAALNEIFDYGRPASVMLVVLVDRSGRELPIQPDVAATTMDLPTGQHVKLIGPDPLSLVVQRAA